MAKEIWETLYTIFSTAFIFLFYFTVFLSENVNHEQTVSKTWFDATLVYRFNECNQRSYNSQTQHFDTPV